MTIQENNKCSEPKRKPRLLVLGGTRFLGASFLSRWGQEFTATVLSRREPQINSENIEWIAGDRFNPAQMENVLRGRSFDVVLDNLCYSADHAKVLLDALGDRFGHLIVVSTRAVYRGGGPYHEDAFDPLTHAYTLGVPLAPFGSMPQPGGIGYGEGKRQAEAYCARNSNSKATLVRLPIILGVSDYTNRLNDLVEGIKNEVSFDFGNELESTSFIGVDEAADALYRLAMAVPQGAVNISSPAITIADLIATFEKVLGIPVKRGVGEGVVLSPFRAIENTTLVCSGASALGIHCSSIEATLEALIALAQ